MTPIVLTPDCAIIRYYAFTNFSTPENWDTRYEISQWDSCSMWRALIKSTVLAGIILGAVLALSLILGSGFWLLMYAALWPGVPFNFFVMEGFEGFGTILLLFGSGIGIVFAAGSFVLTGRLKDLVQKYFPTVQKPQLRKRSKTWESFVEMYDSIKNKYCRPVTYERYVE